MAQYQDRASEKTRLREKRIELDALRSRHEELRLTLQRLRQQVMEFERDYDATLGRRMAELELIEAEIELLGGCWSRDEGVAEPVREQYSYSFRFAAGTSQSTTWRSETQDIKSLYREVAKAVHPDLVPAGAARDDRNVLMSQANQAYQNNDRRTLQEMLRKWGDAPSAELAQLERQIAGEHDAICAANAKVEELRSSFACRFGFKSAGDCAGATLLAEMVHAVDLQIGRGRERLARLRQAAGTGEPRQPKEQYQGPKKKLEFPEESACGMLFVRDGMSLNFSQWRRIGTARGGIEVQADQAVRLDVKVQPGVLGQLRQLRRDDLQSLFLYGACDADMYSIAHLTGLEELYLSGTGLTDAALRCIAPLTNLKRIYIYQTRISDIGLSYLQHFPNLSAITSSGNSITDAGLAGFQMAIPRVKTTSFQWKR